jgi:1-pyrroline-5-carboxylate dehydrogenase
VGPVEDFSHFVNAVIDRTSFDNITGYIDHAAQASDAEIAFGGTYSDEVGFFVDPTVIVTSNPQFKTMREEIFGPVVTIYVYDDADWEATMQLVDETSPYALTGAVFAKERSVLAQASDRLVHAAGNFYLNDKPTGAVVGQQPFGGGRASGTNDKAGSLLNLTRWVSPRSIKENFAPPTDFVYPFLAPDEGAI